MTVRDKNNITKVVVGRMIIASVVVWLFYSFEASAWKFIVGYAALYAFLTAGEKLYIFMDWPGPFALTIYPKAGFDWLWHGFSWRSAYFRDPEPGDKDS